MISSENHMKEFGSSVWFKARQPLCRPSNGCCAVECLYVLKSIPKKILWTSDLNIIAAMRSVGFRGVQIKHANTHVRDSGASESLNILHRLTTASSVCLHPEHIA
jgi:hypothetical protein